MKKIEARLQLVIFAPLLNMNRFQSGWQIFVHLEKT